FMVDCDAPEHVLGQPGADFLRLVPTVWDDIKVLGGYPGEYIAIARRKGNRWFVAVMNNSTTRALQLPLDFLRRGQYRLQSWEDAADAGANPQHLVTAQKTANAQTVLSVDMAPGGGFVACITPLK
ncbi:MAG TPA: glycoside hydrolase family 97 C-terminal domain-containing protein, partial [Chitinophagaceae bacterium]|nr:glycoside hydrolase family 97 C-terminal domain-containing protein [Chitinophagaceae bacterium]